MEDTLVLLDIGYLDKIATAMGNGQRIQLKYIDFCNYLAKKQNLNCKKIYYYCAPPYQDETPTPDQSRRKAGYDRFVNAMRKKYKNFIIREGRLQLIYVEDRKGKFIKRYNQKGVDTWLTMDLLEEPVNEKVKNIILVASDSDFVPVIKRIRSRGITVCLYYYIYYDEDSKMVMSDHLLDACGRSNTFILAKEDFEKNKHIPKY